MAIDITPPILKSLVFPKVVDISQGTAPFKISAAADGTGSVISGVRLFFDKPLIAIYNYIVNPTQSPLSNFGFYFLDGIYAEDNWDDGQVSQTFGIKPSNENQTFQLLKVVVLDKEGNERTYLVDELAQMGISTDFSVIGSAIDKSPPTISISSITTALNKSQTASVTFALSELSTNFTLSDISVNGGTLSNFAGSGITYTALFTPSTNSTSNGVISVASSVFTDVGGNLNADGLDANNTLTIVVDTISPTIALSSSKSSLIAGDTTIVTFTLSESSTNFVSSDVMVTGGTLSNFTGSGVAYSALFTLAANSNINAFVQVASGVFTDAVGNANADGSDANNLLTLIVDTLLPTIAVSSNKASLQGGDSATVTFTLSEASTNFTASDITVIGGTLSNFIGSGTSYTATFTLIANSDVSGTLNIASGVFTDSAGNKNADGSDANNFLNILRITTITNESHTLSVIVDKNVLGAEAIFLKGLKESITYTNGAITKHFVEYAGSTFEYNQIDSLITTVTRDGEFTTEFNKEINDYLNYELNIPYSAAVKLVGATSIDGVIISVAGADGNFVG